MMHFAGIGWMCSSWTEGDQETIDWKHVSCQSCLDHLDVGLDGPRPSGVVDGRECPACGNELAQVDEGDTARCSGCDVEFMCVNYRVMFPMRVDGDRLEALVADAKAAPGEAASSSDRVLVDEVRALAAEVRLLRARKVAQT